MSVTVPTRFEPNFAKEDGSQGSSLKDAFSFQADKVENLYTFDQGSKQFRLSFQEHGVAYGETVATDKLVEVSLDLPGQSDFQLSFSSEPVTIWGINFAGSVKVIHPGSEARIIYLPGTRTYDPAGITGDPHASERIGPSCSRTQAGISLAQLVAALKGASIEMLQRVQDNLRPVITNYHGRVFLFSWMFLQIQEAIYKNKPVTPYPEYLKREILKNNLVLTDAHDHTRQYLANYNKGNPQPPTHYYRKVAAKDNIADLLSGSDLEKFNRMASQ